jgi:class 3 adenylate cyclase
VPCLWNGEPTGPSLLRQLRDAAPAPGIGQPVAERRLVSVLFADLVGFTPFAEERDAEEVRDTLSRYFDLASEVIGRYGGTVEKFIGDAVMAVWGTPTARASRVGIWLGDAGVAADELARYWAAAGHEGAVTVDRDILSAGLAALRGEREAALQQYRDALARLRDLRIPIDEVFAAIDMAYTLGGDEPVAAEAIATARGNIARVRSQPLGALLDTAIATGARVATSQGRGARSRPRTADAPIEA